MNAFFHFIKKRYALLLFLILEAATIHYYTTHSQTGRAKSTNTAFRIHETITDIEDYFALKETNKALNSEIADLTNKLRRMQDTLSAAENYRQLSLPITGTVSARARIVNVIVTQNERYLLIDKGTRDSIQQNMAATTGNSVVGFVAEVYSRHSVVRSLLSKSVKTGGMLKKDSTICSVFWDGKSNEELNFDEMSKYAAIAKGDTIMTTDFSTIFPPAMIIGTVSEFELVDGMYYKGKIRFLTDLHKLRYIDLSRNNLDEERKRIEQTHTN